MTIDHIKDYCKIYCINGTKTAGKDTFVEFCRKYLGEGYEYMRNQRVLNISTVDFVKHIALEAGWNGVKTEKDRKFLSDLKDLLTAWDDVPYKKIVEGIADWIFDLKTRCSMPDNKLVVFIHVREPEEIAKIVDRLNAQTILIRRPDVEQQECSNHADALVNNYDYNYVIDNDGSLEDFKLKAELFCKVECLI